MHLSDVFCILSGLSFESTNSEQIALATLQSVIGPAMARYGDRAEGPMQPRHGDMGATWTVRASGVCADFAEAKVCLQDSGAEDDGILTDNSANRNLCQVLQGGRGCIHWLLSGILFVRDQHVRVADAIHPPNNQKKSTRHESSIRLQLNWTVLCIYHNWSTKE